MPHCQAWGEGDWAFARESLLALSRIIEHESTAAAAELRIREQLMGCTLSGRQSLRVRYCEPAADSDAHAAVADLSDYRNL